MVPEPATLTVPVSMLMQEPVGPAQVPVQGPVQHVLGLPAPMQNPLGPFGVLPAPLQAPLPPPPVYPKGPPPAFRQPSGSGADVPRSINVDTLTSVVRSRLCGK